jgi:hypothetical protein
VGDHAKLGDQLAVEGLRGCLEQLIMMLDTLVVGAEQVQVGYTSSAGPAIWARTSSVSAANASRVALWPKTGSPVTGSGAAWTAATVIISISHPPGCCLIRREHRVSSRGVCRVELVAPVSWPGMS